MRGIKIVLVGKIRKGFRKEAFDFYFKKIKPYTQVDIFTIKDAKSGDIPSRMEKEGQLILDRLEPRDYTLALDEKGKSFTSRNFSQELAKLEQDPAKVPCFIIGGAYGLSHSVKSASDILLSFGPMTLPHELAAIMLMEQIYRAHTIMRGHPYHH